MDQNIFQKPPEQDPLNKQNLHSEIPSSGNKTKWILSVVVLLFLVGFGAYSLGANKNKPLSQNQQTLTPTQPVPTSTPDPTANWKAYEGEFYTFKYPSNWEIKPFPGDGDVGAARVGPIGSDFSLVFSSGVYDNTTPQEIIKRIITTIPPIDTIISENKIMVDGHEAIVLESYNYNTPDKSRRNSLVVYVSGVNQIAQEGSTEKGPGKLLNLKGTLTLGIWNVTDKTDLEKIRPTFYQILSTFKFTDQNQTSNISADSFIQNYYNSYLSCIGGNAGGDCSGSVDNFTSSFYSQLQNGQVNPGGDHILCAQNVPLSLTFDQATVSSDGITATAVVHTIWGSNPPRSINVGLQKVNNQWKIASISCNK